MLFHSADESIFVPQYVKLVIITNCESIVLNSEMIAMYKIRLATDCISKSIETIRANIDEIFYNLLPCFPAHITIMLSKHKELVAELTPTLVFFQNRMQSTLSAASKDLIGLFLPAVQHLHSIGWKMLALIGHSEVAFSPSTLHYVYFQLEIITRSKSLTEAFIVLKECLLEMEANNNELLLAAVDRDLIGQLCGGINHSMSIFDQSVNKFLAHCEQSTPDVAKRIEWLNEIDLFEGIQYSYHLLFSSIFPSAYSPLNAALAAKFDRVLHNFSYVSDVYRERIESMRP